MAKREFSKIQQFLFIIEAVVLLPLVHIISWVCPYNKTYDLSKFMGKLFLIISPNKRQVIIKNLAIIFPDKEFSQEEIQRISCVMAGYELRILLEMILISRMNFQTLISYIRINQHDQISKVYHTQENSFVGFTLHFGNWELLGCFLNQIDIPLACLVERQFNHVLDNYLQYLRKRLGIITIYNEISLMKPLLKYMKQGGGIALVADQSYWFDPLFIPFFDQDAAVPQGAAALALRLKSSLFCGYTTYQDNGVYMVDIDTNIISDNEISKLSTEDLMKIVYKKYEEIIRQDVSNWYTLGSDRWGLTRESLEEWKKNPDSSRF